MLLAIDCASYSLNGLEMPSINRISRHSLTASLPLLHSAYTFGLTRSWAALRRELANGGRAGCLTLHPIIVRDRLQWLIDELNHPPRHVFDTHLGE